MLLISDGGRRAVEFRDVDGERFVIGPGPILQDAERNLLAQKDRPVGRAAEVYAGMNAVSQRDVVRQLIEFSVNVQAVPVRTRVGVEREAIRAWLVHVSARACEQRPDLLAAVEEEFQHRNASAAYGPMTRGIARVRW